MYSQGVLLHLSDQEKQHQVVEQVCILESEGSGSELVLSPTRCATLGKLLTPLSTVSPALIAILQDCREEYVCGIHGF